MNMSAVSAWSGSVKHNGLVLGGGLGDVADQTTAVGVVFAADSGVGIGDYGEGKDFVDVVEEWEVGDSGFDEGGSITHGYDNMFGNCVG